MRMRCGPLRIVQTSVFVAALALAVTPALAVHNDQIFQIDGDVETGPSTTSCGGNSSATGPSSFGGTVGCTGEDWDKLYSCTGSAEGDCSASLACDVNGNGVLDGGECTTNHANVISEIVYDPAPMTIFTGGGSKDEKDLSQWLWKDGSVPDKDDLIEAFAALYVGPPGGARPGDRILYFGANRLSVNGDAQIGFWFLQNPTELGTTKVMGGSPFVDPVLGGPAHHKIGDLLILSNFVNGGGSSNIQVYEVVSLPQSNNEACPAGSVETKGSLGDVCLRQLVNGTAGSNGVCNPAIAPYPADAACAATNGQVISALDPAFVPKDGATTGQYAVVGFFEGGLSLGDLGLGGECFATFIVETRSSQSVDAVLKDFTRGDFERCVADITTDIHDDSDDSIITGGSVVPGAVIYDTATVTGIQNGPDPGKNGDGDCTLVPGRDCTVTFSRFASTDCTGTPVMETVDCLSDGDGSGTCTATSSTFTTTAPPGYSYLASYAGDSNYPPVATPITSCEVLTVNKVNSAISTQLFQVAGARGAAPDCSIDPVPTACEVTDSLIQLDTTTPTTINVQDRALVTPASISCGGAGQPPCPTGTVTFSRYPHADCSGTATVESGVSLDSAATLCTGQSDSCAQSSVFALGADGVGYRATYSGDTLYNPSEVSRCEPVCAVNIGIPAFTPTP